MDRKGRFPIEDDIEQKCLFDSNFSIEQSDRHNPSKNYLFNGMRGSDCSTEKVFEAHRISRHLTEHTITAYNSSDAGLTATVLLLLLTTTRRGTYCSPPSSSAYRDPMAAMRVIDDLLLLLLLLLCSLWRLSTKSKSSTATMKRMGAPRAPNERFARGKSATKMRA